MIWNLFWGVLYHDLLYLFDNCKALFSEMECRNTLDGICACTDLGRSESSLPVEPTGTCSSFWLTTYSLCLVDVFFQHTVGIPMGTSCAPLLADLFIYSYEADFIQGLLKKNEKKLARCFNFTFRYIDDVLSLNNSRFGDFVDRIYSLSLK